LSEFGQLENKAESIFEGGS